MLKNVLIYQIDGTESVWMRAAAKHPYCCYPVARAAYNAVQHSHSQPLGILGAQVPIDLLKNGHKKEMSFFSSLLPFIFVSSKSTILSNLQFIKENQNTKTVRTSHTHFHGTYQFEKFIGNFPLSSMTAQTADWLQMICMSGCSCFYS